MKDGEVVRLQTREGSFTAGLAITDASRQRGLSGRPFLPRGHGLLFVFPAEGQQAMWMKDMRFPLDVAWLDAGMVVTSVEKDCFPCLGDGRCYRYESGVVVRYALELNAGEADALGVRVGERVWFT